MVFLKQWRPLLRSPTYGLLFTRLYFMRWGSFQSRLKTGKKEASFILLCALLLLLFAGAAYVVFLGNDLRFWDEGHYLTLSKNLHQGIYSFNGVTPTAFQPPGYPFTLYLLSWISSSLLFLRFANFIFLSCAVALLYWILKKETDALTALIGALIAAAYPLFFYTAGTFYPQILSSALFLLALALILSLSRPNWKKEIAVGLTLGMLVLTVPSFLLYLPLWIAYPWFGKNPKKWRAATLLLIGFSVIAGSWITRNAIAFDRFVLVSSNSGINLLLGNSHHTTALSGVNANLDAFLAVGGKMNEFEQDAYYRQEAIRWVKDNPFQALQLYLKKSLNFFNFQNDLASKEEKSWGKDVLSFISFYPFLLLALGRLFVSARYPLKPFEWFLALFLLASPFLQAIFFTRIRFRIPFDFIIIYFAASSLSLMIERFSLTEAPSENRGGQ